MRADLNRIKGHLLTTVGINLASDMWDVRSRTGKTNWVAMLSECSTYRKIT